MSAAKALAALEARTASPWKGDETLRGGIVGAVLLERGEHYDVTKSYKAGVEVWSKYFNGTHNERHNNTTDAFDVWDIRAAFQIPGPPQSFTGFQVSGRSIVLQIEGSKREELAGDPGGVYEILSAGAARARETARATIERVYKAVGLR